MRIRRPLVFAAAALFLTLLCIPREVFQRECLPGLENVSPDTLSGEICSINPGGASFYLKDNNVSEDGLILVYLGEADGLRIGDLVEISDFVLYEPDEPSNPGQFDAALYYQIKKTVLICYADDLAVTASKGRPVRQFFYELREKLGECCGLLFDGEYSGTVRAMLLGDKSGLDDDIKEVYQKSGMSHLLAISGLHVSILGMSLYRILRKIGAGYALSGVPAISAAVFYGILTGMGISTVRAVIMFAVMIVADIIGRSYDLLSALALSAIMLMLEQPLCVRSASFTLSFAAVLGIAVIFPLAAELFRTRGKLSRALALSVSVQVMTLPLIEWFYYQVPVYGVILNLAVVPLMSLVMYFGIAAVAAGMIFIPLGRLLARPCILLLWLFGKAGTISLSLPGAVFTVGAPNVLQMAVYYAGVAAFVIWRMRVRARSKKMICEAASAGDDGSGGKRSEKFVFRKQICTLGFGLLLFAVLSLRVGRGFEFTMLDVGQGDGMFLRSGSGMTVLIDGGSSDESGVGTYRILPFLEYKGVGRLDYIIVTHADSDHISGIEEILTEAAKPGGMKVGTLLLSPQAMADEGGEYLAQLAIEAGTAVEEIHRGMTLADKNVSLEFLYPVEGVEYTDQNAASCVINLVYGEFTMLLTGDLEEEGEEELLALGDDIDCDVLKVGHHGSKTSSSLAFLEAVTPKAALISCGEGNSYGHPHEETLERLEAVGSAVFTTMDFGALTIKSDGTGFSISGYLGG